MYNQFANIYDTLNGTEFYQQWYEMLQAYITTSTKQVLDLGCGSATLLKLISADGIGVTGVDLSADMLALAEEKFADSNGFHAFYQNNMAEFLDANNSYDIILSSCDSLNYLATIEEIQQTFQHAFSMLKNQGYFIFDMHADMMFTTKFQDWSYGDADETLSVIWNTMTDDDTCFEHFLTFFLQQENGMYVRFDELHRQYKYTKETIKHILQEIGFTIVTITSDFDDVFHQDGERTFYVVQKNIENEIEKVE